MGQKDLKSALRYVKTGQYCEAIPYFNAYLAKYIDKKALVQRGLCQFHCNQLDGAIADFENAQLLEYDEADIDYHLARCYQHKNEFELAIIYLKKYLARNLKKEAVKTKIIQEINRCALGLDLQYRTNNDLIENMGPGINTGLDEINIFQSPNSLEKFYFSRSKSDDPNAYGIHYYTVDSSLQEMAGYLNPDPSNQNEFLVDISPDGLHLYFSRFFKESGKNLLLEDRYVPGQDPMSAIQKFTGPVEYGESDRYFHLVNDSIFLFSSNRPGGYGGYDIYVTGIKNGYWLKPQNLGVPVNSPFDELGPCMTKDGKTLFFSSNGNTSIGGFDVFKTTFNNGTREWDIPQNMGFPMNSPADELSFRLAFDGSSCFISSDRKEGGFGGFDIYRVFFRNAFPDKPETELPFLSKLNFENAWPLRTSGDKALDLPIVNKETRQEKEPIQGFEEKIISTVDKYIEGQNEISVIPENDDRFKIKSLFYDKKLPVLELEANQVIIKDLVNFLGINSDATIILTAHCWPGTSRLEDLIFTRKVLDPVVAYLKENGIQPERIQQVAAGSNFPNARVQVTKSLKPASERYNNRIELTLDMENSDNKTKQDPPFIVPHLKDGKWILYKSLLPGLSYKLKVVELRYLENAPFINDMDNCLVEIDPFNLKNIVYSGIYKQYKNAVEAAENLNSSFQINAKVVPFIDGKILNQADVLEKAKTFMDLVNYLEAME